MNETKLERAKMILAMEYCVRNVNKEDLMNLWLCEGVADGDLEYGENDPDNVNDYYLEDQNFAHIMKIFLKIMRYAEEDGGLYCGEIVSE